MRLELLQILFIDYMYDAQIDARKINLHSQLAKSNVPTL